MPLRVAGIARAVLLATPLIGVAAAAADSNGPMSSTRPVTAASAAPAASAAAAPFDVEKLFANTCGWCHSSAGRTAGRGPKLMDTTLTDAEIVNRIKNGKQGAMPAFGTAFSDEQIKAIVKYIRDLKPASQ